MRRSIAAAVVPVALVLTLPTSCSNPTGIVTPVEPYPTAASVVDSLLSAYNAMDVESYLACFRDDFRYHFLLSEWGQHWTEPWPEGWWGLVAEAAFHEVMFDQDIIVELTLSGTQESEWSGDTTGASMSLPRTFDLKIYTDSTGYRATGSALFICRQDSLDAWYVWQWWDISQTCEGLFDGLPMPLEANTWSYIKYFFGNSGTVY